MFGDYIGLYCPSLKAPCAMWRARDQQLAISHSKVARQPGHPECFKARKNCGRNSAGRIYVPAVQAANFKKCSPEVGPF